MRSFRSAVLLHPLRSGLLLAAVAGIALQAGGALPAWLRYVEPGTGLESALFRLMEMPGAAVLFHRPPSETRPALAELIKAKPGDGALYSMRALEDEQGLDFAAAEADWKAWVDHAPDPFHARMDLAGFYARRLRPADEVAALEAAAAMSSPPSEKWTASRQQRSWQAFERIFAVIADENMPATVTDSQYRGWMARYPKEGSVYSAYLQFLLVQKRYKDASSLVAEYERAFPGDKIFPVKAAALIEYRQGSVDRALAVYDREFQPLWPAELVQNYFALLKETGNERVFLDKARSALNANPDDLWAAARIFYYYQQQGRLDAAEQAIDQYRQHKEQRNAAWKPEELYTLAKLMDDVRDFPEAARYYYALYSSPGAGSGDAQQRGLVGMAHVLLAAPEQPLRVGAGDLSMYRDIATLDRGPGYWNGILSLFFNSTSPEYEHATEEQRATPYFHRARASQLLAQIDTRYPNAPERPELHAELIEAYATYGENDAVLRTGKAFLDTFAKDANRTRVALLMADADARLDRTQDEFAVYDSLLKEMAAQADGVPLGEGAVDHKITRRQTTMQRNLPPDNAGNNATDEDGDNQQRAAINPALNVAVTNSDTPASAVHSPDYASVLDRYLARLVSTKQIPQALAVLRQELDRNRNDPGIYEKLAQFLAQNDLSAEQEDVYKRAIQQFPDSSWYHKLARFYLREKRDSEFSNLTQQVVKTFSGTDLDEYFRDVVGGGPQLYLRLNQFAAKRFPHDPVFVENLLRAYTTKATRDDAAWLALIRQHWFEEEQLRGEFFEYLSRTGKLESELQTLRHSNAEIEKGAWSQIAQHNPAATRFYTEALLWQSHFEQAAGAAGALAHEYPADLEFDRRASSLLRSLAAFDAKQTEAAVAIEKNLLAGNPGDLDTLARIGDIYADRELFAEATPYWEKMAEVRPHQADGYLQSATVFWDYFDFEKALAQLQKGRQALGIPELYSYEAGAIYENRRDYPRAIEEYTRGALANTSGSEARTRLLVLARRKSHRDLVDQATAKLVDEGAPSLEAIHLRLDVLAAQDRKTDEQRLVLTLLDKTTSFPVIDELQQVAKALSFDAGEERAMQRQIALTSDPVRKTEERYTLARFYEDRRKLDAAQALIEAIYKEQPKVLGVVRATVDFYWRNKMQARSVGVLEQASQIAYPELGRQFSFEAARKLTDMGEYAQARALLTELMKAVPYDGSYVAAMADTYGRGGDDAGLREFYLATIESLRKSTLPAAERTTRIAELRRGLIPALTRLKDFAGGVDQYIELINLYPEDEELTSEAALYAQRNGRQAQIVQFYAKTTAASPQDSRWFIVLGRLQRSLEDYPAAIEAFSHAMKIRPDRSDVLQAKASLEERLRRFDDAVADYEKLYTLTYKDPRWLESAAEVRARQGKTDLAVKALTAALIDGRPERAENYFEVARRLEGWGMLNEARGFAEKGVSVAGDDFLVESGAGVSIYVRVMVRLRQQEAAYTKLIASLDAGRKLPLNVLEQQVAKEGVAAATDKQWRQRQREMREQAARRGMSAGMREMGSTVGEYFTPEEKLAFARLMQTKRVGLPTLDVDAFLVPLADAAGLMDLDVKWRTEILMEGSANRAWANQYEQLKGLLERRLQFAELGALFERFAARRPGTERSGILQDAAHAYEMSGDASAELRVRSELHGLSGGFEDRYLSLLLSKDPQQLVSFAATGEPGPRDAVANYVVANADLSLTREVLSARGNGLPVAWRNAYMSLSGFYFRDTTAATHDSFVTLLGDGTIEKRLATPGDRNAQLAGTIWFYYGSRFGEFLDLAKSSDAVDYLPSSLELNPQSSANYKELADYYAATGKPAEALTEYAHVLELNSRRADVYDSMARLEWQQGRHAEAIDSWKKAVDVFAQYSAQHNWPQSFSNDFVAVIDHISSKGQFDEVRASVEHVLRSYIAANGEYQSLPMLRSAYRALHDPAEGTRWMLEFAAAAPVPEELLSQLSRASWIPLAEREPLMARRLQLAEAGVSGREGSERANAISVLATVDEAWVGYLIQTKQYERARAAIDALPEEVKGQNPDGWAGWKLKLAAHQGTLAKVLASYRSDAGGASAGRAPSDEVLRATALQLKADGEATSSQMLLEYLYSRAIDAHRLESANFLGLAEIRLQQGDRATAVDLLRRMTMVAGDLYSSFDSAAALLMRNGHPAEALEFARPLAEGVPWNASYRIRLAQAEIAADQQSQQAHESLTSVASSSLVSYSVRADAAKALVGSHTAADLKSGELQALASGGAISAAQAERPYYYLASVAAAKSVSAARTRLALLRRAIADQPGSNEVRALLFQAALNAGDYRTALNAMVPVLGRDSYRGFAGREGVDAENEGTDAPDYAGSESQEPTVLGGFPAAQRATIAAGLARAYQELNQPDQALSYAKMALHLENDADARKQLQSRVSALRALISRRAGNAARRPVIHDTLEQNRLVRPRLLASTEARSARPPGSPAAKTGGKP